MTTQRFVPSAVSMGTCKALPDLLLGRWRFHVHSCSGQSLSRFQVVSDFSPPPSPTPSLLANPGDSTCETYSGLNYFSPLESLLTQAIMVSEGGTATASAPVPAPRASTASRGILGIPDQTVSVPCLNLTMPSADPVSPANMTPLTLSASLFTPATWPCCPCAGVPGASPLLLESCLPEYSRH